MKTVVCQVFIKPCSEEFSMYMSVGRTGERKAARWASNVCKQWNWDQ